MFTLGIETSCDETAASVVLDGKKICSNVTASSIRYHSKFGGVVPEIASRAQLEYIYPVVDQALRKARIKLKDLDLVAVTKGPGLIGSLLIGISFAKALSLANNISLIGVDHVQAHLYPVFLNNKSKEEFPFAGLVVSGGHTNLYYCRSFDDFRLVGQTLDDAAGESFDKVAKLLKLGYPGGPKIERLAKRGDYHAFDFNCNSKHLGFNFSFSGIKTQVLYLIRDLEKKKKLDIHTKRNIAASFQHQVVSSLVEKTISYIIKNKLRILVVGGGVASNQYFRKLLAEVAKKFRIRIYFPPLELCTDNAAMVAGFGYQLYKKGKKDNLNLRPVLYK